MSRVFTSASDDTLCHLVATARERLVIVSPGLSHFRDKIEAHFGKEEAAKLLSEYDASRAQQSSTIPK